MVTNNNIITKYLTDDSYVVVGCSAGPDSMALLSMMIEYKKDKIVCCHINHNVREESKKEEEYLRDYCQKKGVIFETMMIGSFHENNFENEARKKRYAFYEKILNKYHSKYLFLAHHGDDLIETVLMKIVRGSNITGYSGIKETSYVNGYYIIRPLLDYTKDDLIIYNNERGIKFFIDKSNDDINYTRNRYRKKILPFLKNEDKNVHLKFREFSNTLIKYDDFVKDMVKEYINKEYHRHTLSVNSLRSLHPFLMENVIFYVLNDLYDNKTDIVKRKHVDSIIKLIMGNKPNNEVILPKNKVCFREYDKLSLGPIMDKKEDYKLELRDNNVIGKHVIRIIDNTKENGNDICLLDSSKIMLPLYIRNRKEGDVIRVLGLDGTKKVKDIFIEKKINLKERDEYPLLVDSDDNILWIPNLKKSQFNIKNKEKYDIILKYCEKEENDE